MKSPDLSHIKNIYVDPDAPGDMKVWEIGDTLIVNEKTWEYMRARMELSFNVDALARRGIRVFAKPGSHAKIDEFNVIHRWN